MTEVGEGIIQGLKEALEYAKGNTPAGTRTHVVHVDPLDVKAIREQLEVTQERMAELMGTSLSGYRKWEQGQRKLSGPAKNLLYVMMREPKAAVRALTSA